MKNFGFIFTLIVALVTLVSARVLPLGKSLDARDVVPFEDAAEVELRSPKKAATHTTDAISSKVTVAATSSSAAAKKAGKGGTIKGKDSKQGNTACNATEAANSKDVTSQQSNCTLVATGSTANATTTALNEADATNTTSTAASTSSAATKKGGKTKSHKGKEPKIGGNAANATTVADGHSKSHAQGAGETDSKKKGAAAKTETASDDSSSTLVQALGLLG